MCGHDDGSWCDEPTDSKAAAEAYLAEMERLRLKTDGAYELAMSRLKKAGGSIWQDRLCQADIINTIVDAVREYDARKK